MRIAVDAMGGDEAPFEIVKGAVDAARVYTGHEIILVGDQERIRNELAAYGATFGNISVVHASQVVDMNESATVAVRKKVDSSITKSVKLVSEKAADAVVSAGNTGATVAAASLFLRMLKNVKRPGIAVSIPTFHGACMVIDAGANIQCKPAHLMQYGVMASVFCKYVLNIEKPRVGLLNIGEEDAKGNELVKETFALLSSSQLNFVGNAEGRDVFDGKFDIVVCEGFVGNVLLKFAEGLSISLLTAFALEAKNSTLTKLGAWLCKPVCKQLRSKMDYTEYGGVPLLGIDGICIIAHGRSDSKAIQNAIREAIQFGKYEVNKHISSELERTNSSFVTAT
ncbi:MAG: phosphate acyltransferase [Planctomycetes bacterium GWA2_40_7]|nr:MAG: phosphate acyltransferase [Planctomycetes bacterium GWA2_40_7]OHB47842.1 MAG: phosphate acyltransferase [Planctomycetes bacterium GWF2_40_8]OHB88402.1 MAG: phosphate acyltransferase [Planctomycetes bacterium RIFCSPHIGHO2_02_FULL_40_12]OHC03163.1 MAG: phosphate acyltransferase [Planctomycetes bacterium RIFCSPLOWO2_12_FULL_40_19]